MQGVHNCRLVIFCIILYNKINGIEHLSSQDGRGTASLCVRHLAFKEKTSTNRHHGPLGQWLWSPYPLSW